MEECGGVCVFLFSVSSGPVDSQEALCPRLCPERGGLLPGYRPCLELRAGRRFGGGHDLHVLGEDGLEGLVSVDHGTKHQWLEGDRNGFN